MPKEKETWENDYSHTVGGVPFYPINKVKEEIQKAREEEREKIREFLSSSSVWDTEYIYIRKALLLQKFDELINKNNEGNKI